MKQKRFDKLQRRLQKADQCRHILDGTGCYVYRNNTSGSLELPKPHNGGTRTVAHKGEFEGDNYFMKLVQTNDLVYVRAVVTPIEERKMLVEEKKLLLDQPDRYTQQGKTEQVVPNTEKVKPLNENRPHKGKKAKVEKAEQPVDTLINEDPLAGVEIIIS